jgi:hypothetical protein
MWRLCHPSNPYDKLEIFIKFTRNSNNIKHQINYLKRY